MPSSSNLPTDDQPPDDATDALTEPSGAYATSLSMPFPPFIDPGQPAKPGDRGGPGSLPEALGRYRVDCFLARGGMGEVFRVIDVDFDRPLALKVLQERYRGHAELTERFLREARLTAQLQHPGIPPVQEVGRLPNGRPYFIMKLVQGHSLQQLLRERRSPSEGQAHLLGIFEQVCRTVAYAHAQGVLHRDLKPGNVMVGAFGEVQVMDWGLAKVLSVDPLADTVTPVKELLSAASVAASVAGNVLGTPAYMAPEQARGEVDTLDARSDVFGLGGILCDILTSQPPFAGDNHRDNHRRAVRGDLEETFARLDGCGADAELVAVARVCLAPDRADRPRDAGAVADAVAAYQEVERERLRLAEVARGQAQVRAEEEHKRLLLERQKRQVTLVLAGAVLLVLLAGIGATVAALLRAWEQTDRAEGAEQEAVAKATLAQERSAEAEKQRGLANAKGRAAQEQAEIARKVKDYLVETFRSPDPYAAGDKVTVAEALKQAVKEIDRLDQPLLQEELLTAIGRTCLHLRLTEAVDVWKKVVALQTRRLGADHVETLAGVNFLGLAYQADGQPEQAVPLLREVLAKRQARLGEDHPDTLRTLSGLAAAYQDLERLDEAVPLFEAVLARMQTRLGPDHADTLAAMSQLGLAYLAAGRHEKAVTVLQELLTKRETQLGPDHADTLHSRDHLARAYHQAGDFARALPMYLQILKKRQEVLGVNHPDTFVSMNHLALAYQDNGQLPKALPLFEEALAKTWVRLGADHPITQMTVNHLGLAYQADGQWKKALPMLEELLSKRKRQHGSDHPHTLTSLSNLAVAYLEAGRPADAEKLFAEWVERRRPRLPADDVTLARGLHRLGACRVLLRKFAQAEAPLRDCVEVYRKQRPGSSLLFDAQSLLGASLAGQEQFTAAEPLLLGAVQGFQELGAKLSPEERRRGSAALDRLIDFYETRGNAAEVGRWRAVRDARDGRTPEAGDGGPVQRRRFKASRQ
jgi:tetratricopeptide (TPR) repeat protein